MVQQTAWRGHQNFDAFFELKGLGLHVHAAKHHGAAQVGVLGVQLDLLRHLVGQFARGQQNKGAHRVAGRRGRAVFVLHQAVQQRQRERCSFARTGLGGTHHVFAGNDHRNRLGLDRRHGLVAHLGDGAGQRISQLQLGKRHQGRICVQFVRIFGGSWCIQISIQVGHA